MTDTKKKTKILVIEDNEVLGDILLAKLKKAGYDTYLATDGEEGLRQVDSYEPDLILLDIVLPKKDGYEILEELHGRGGPDAYPPTIIISNSGQYVEISKVLAMGVKDYVIKADFDPDEVIRKIITVLDEENPEDNPLAQSGNTILVVEDDDFLRELITEKLKQRHCSIDMALDGENAIKMMKDRKYAIVLLDLMLPGIDGFEVLEQARKDSLNMETPIIIFSNLGQNEDIKRAKKLGADEFLIKANINIDEVIIKMKELLVKQQKKDKDKKKKSG